MAKTYLSTVKYVIKTNFTIEGIVDKHDIIGAIFGQSEGLIGEEMDLKELQRNGKLGRIEVDTQTKSGKTVGFLTIPSSLDRVQTSILAAAIESVDKVGPCNSGFQTESIEDARQEKRKIVTERARQLLMGMSAEMPETQELAESIRGSARVSGLKEIGRDNIPIGPEVDSSDELILVEGRADVINLLKHGIKNVAGVGGAKVPITIINLAKGKKVTLFVDGDRGGDIIARQLSRAIDVTFVAKAPDGKEVEELTLKEILSSLRRKEESGPISRMARPEPIRERRAGYGNDRRASYRGDNSSYRGDGPSRGGRERSYSGGNRRFPSRDRSFSGRDRSFPDRERSFSDRRGPPRERESAPRTPMKANDLGTFNDQMKKLEGSLKAHVLDEKNKVLKEVDVRDLLKEIGKFKGADAIVLDGIITKRLLVEAEKNKVKQLIGVKKGRIEESKEVKVETLY